MNKVIHAAVRRDLARLEAALGAVDDGDLRRAGDLNRAWRQLHDQLRHHHHQEDTIIFPTTIGLGIDPALVDTLESEHQAMAQALDDIDAAMRSYAGSGTLVDAAIALEAMRRGHGVVDQHLTHEEGEFEPLVRQHLESDAWKAAMRQIRKQPPKRAGWFFAWLSDGLSDEAKKYLDSEVPTPVQFVFGRGFGRGYHKTIAPIWQRA